MVQRRHIDVEQGLRGLGARLALVAQPHDQQQHMKGVKLEPRVDPVSDAHPGIEAGVARLPNRQFIQRLAQTLAGTGSEEILKHDHAAPFPPRR